MITLLDAVLLSLILAFYGVGDVVSTLYGMSRHGLQEGNGIMVGVFGERFRWYESIAAKVATLGGVAFIYFVARILYSSVMYRTLWWLIATAIILRGVQVTLCNWRDIQAARR